MSGELRCWDDEPGCNCANASPRPADITREPTGGQGLREAIARALDDTATGLWMGQHGPGWGDVIAGVLLGLPEMAALIAAGERLRRVRDVLQHWEVAETPPAVMELVLRRALDGEDRT